VPAHADPPTYIVNSANDVNDGTCNAAHCSLREAVIAANASLGGFIEFHIPGAGVHRIALGSMLPTISQPVWIEGWTQARFIGLRTAVPDPLIDIDGQNSVPIGFYVHNVNNFRLSDVVVRRFTSIGVEIDGGSGNAVTASRIGTDPTGTIDQGNGIGVLVNNSTANHIGDSVGNLISGNDNVGVEITGAASTENAVEQNVIGLNASGTAAIPNGIGVLITGGANDNLVGPETYSHGASPNRIADNAWGVQVSGAGSVNNEMRGNAIYGNSVAGIETFTGGNTELTPPTITAGLWLFAAGTACAGCLVEVFSNSVCGQGRRYEGSVIADGSGAWLYNRSTLSGPYISATATQLAYPLYGNTSEFSNCLHIPSPPRLRPGADLGVHLIAPFPALDASRAPGIPSDAYIDMRVPGFDPGPRNIVIHATGSDLMPGGPPAASAEVGRVWVDFDYCGLGHYTLSADALNGGLDGGIELDYTNPGSAAPYLPAGWNPLDVVAALHGSGKGTALYDDAGVPVTGWTLDGDAFAFVLNSPLGGHDIVLGEIGSDAVLGCARITEIRLQLDGTASDGKVFRQNGAAGFYRGFATYSCAASPYGEPCPYPGNRPYPSPPALFVQACDYVDTTPPPVTLDEDGDCLASPTDTNDANPDQDGDGVDDGIEFISGTSISNPDSDGDGVGDAAEIAARTSSVATNDFDGDGKKDIVDNCPRVPNASQADLDGDGAGDSCDNDKDGDGLTNAQEASMKLVTITTPASEKALRCEYGTPTLALLSTDPDTDNDGWRDGAECKLGSNPLNAASTPERCNGADDDGDGLTDEFPLSSSPFVEYDTNPAHCALFDPDGDGAAGATENLIRTINRVGGEFEDLPAGGLLCSDPNVDCNPDGDANNSANDADSDNDGLPDLVEFGQYGSSPANAMSDDDACPDGKEPLLTPPTDPTNGWDFYSVPVPALLSAPNPLLVTRDKVVSALDAQAVFAYFKASAVAGSAIYEQDLNQNGIRDGLEYDRTTLGPGKSGPPDGGVSAQDAQNAFRQFQFGYNCN
jgi:CSLREA domain-containing protein